MKMVLNGGSFFETVPRSGAKTLLQKLDRKSNWHTDFKSIYLQLRTFHFSSLDVLRAGFGRPLDALQPVFRRPNQGRFLKPLAGASRQSTAEIARGDLIGRPPGLAGGCVTGGAPSRSAESMKGERARSLELGSLVYQTARSLRVSFPGARFGEWFIPSQGLFGMSGIVNADYLRSEWLPGCH